MYLTRKHLSRRTMLRGSGVAVALPLLNAMVPAATALAGTEAAPRMRMGFFYLPHGAIMNNTPRGPEMDMWTPTASGRDFEFKPILKPLEKLRDQVTIVSNLENRPGTTSSGHALNPGTWLTCHRPQEGTRVNIATSVDQLAAQHIGQDTPLPSLQLAADGSRSGGACGGTFGCSYSTTLSFSSPTTPLPMEVNPRAVFQRLFGRGATDAERASIISDNRSMLDLIAEQTRSLEARLGAYDRATLSDYLDSVREIERRIVLREQQDLSDMDVPEAPIGVLDSYVAQLELMHDIIELAWKGDLTRIASFMLAAEFTSIAYAHVGVAEGFHPTSHHGNDIDRINKLVRIQTYHARVFADFAERLAAIPEADGSSMLDNSVLLFGSNMSNSDLHNLYPLPTVVVGRAGGRIRGGQHLVYPEHTPLGNLHVTLLDRVGVGVEAVGDSTGELAEV